MSLILLILCLLQPYYHNDVTHTVDSVLATTLLLLWYCALLVPITIMMSFILLILCPHCSYYHNDVTHTVATVLATTLLLCPSHPYYYYHEDSIFTRFLSTSFYLPIPIRSQFCLSLSLILTVCIAILILWPGQLPSCRPYQYKPKLMPTLNVLKPLEQFHLYLYEFSQSLLWPASRLNIMVWDV